MEIKGDSFGWFKKLDFFTKVEEQHLKKSTLGGIVTLVIVVISLVLLFFELRYAFTVHRHYSYSVDHVIARTLEINLDMMVATKCRDLKIDLMDVSRTSIPLYNQLKLQEKPMTIRPSVAPKMFKSIKQLVKEAEKVYSGQASPKGPKEHVGEAVIRHEGCHISGKINANKLQGLIQIVGQNPHGHSNFTHQIERLSFGTDFPGISNPLDYSFDISEKDHMMFQYYLSLVPTIYIDANGNAISTNQYAVTEQRREINHDAGSHGIPGILFHFGIEPIVVRIKESQQPFLHTLTRLSGLIGGVFVTAGLAQRIVNKFFGVVLPKKTH